MSWVQDVKEGEGGRERGEGGRRGRRGTEVERGREREEGRGREGESVCVLPVYKIGRAQSV